MNDVGWYAYTPLNPSTDQFSGPAADPSLDGPPQLADARRLMRRAVTSVVRDADVVFVLTTNRADLLEPALAARPGRVDQAVELTLPDTASRQALFDLYSRQVEVDTSHMDDLLARTDGVTASFIKELLRRACVIAAEAHPDDDALRVSADDLDAALSELLDTRNTMTRVLLGAGDV